MKKLTGLHFVNVDLINSEIEECQRLLQKQEENVIKRSIIISRIVTLEEILKNCESVKQSILNENNY
jgi:hypothetical protein